MIKYYSGALLSLVTYSAAGADVQSFRDEVELFLTSGVGNIVLFVLTLLLLLWLLLPLAVFGLKSKLSKLIQENNNLARDSKETIKILADIRDELAAIRKEETTIVYTNQHERASDDGITKDLVQENNKLNRESKETNKLLTDIRDILAALSAEETTEDYSEQAERADTEDFKLDIYNEVKFDP